MATNLSVNGTTYSYPNTGDSNWGDNVTNWATAVSNSTLQLTGGAFTLTADADFGANFGLKSIYFKSRTSNAASSGLIRLANTEAIGWRDHTHTNDMTLSVVNAGTNDCFRFLASSGDVNVMIGDGSTSNRAQLYFNPGGGNASKIIMSQNTDLYIIASGGATICRFVDSTSVVIGSGSIATNSTAGFPYIPAAAGSPSGTPASQSGYVPMYYDTTNHKFWIYDGAWKGVVVS